MSVVAGLAACAISSFCFGSMYVGVKIAGDPGDGIVVQWIVCSAIFLSGVVTYIVTGAPPFQPFAMLGGLLWALGNLTAIPIIKTIGLGMGILIWGAMNCIVGWATGRFGLFGVKARPPNSLLLNYFGLFLVVVGGIFFAFVRPKLVCRSDRDSRTHQTDASLSLRRDVEEGEDLVGERVDEEERVAETGRMEGNSTNQNAIRKRISAITASVFAGIGYGSTFTPVVYIQDNPEHFKNPSKQAIDYVFSHFTGIYLTSTAVLLIYIGYKRNKPYMDNALVFPSMLAGVLWAIAMLAWFVANDILSQAITFPINAMLPGVIASLWSVLYFKEVEKKDLRLLIVAICITVLGVTLVGMSKTI